MKIQSMVRTAGAMLIVGMLGMTSAAQAAPVVFNATQNLNSTLADGATYSGAFDVSSFFRKGYTYTGLTASLNFIFADDGDAVKLGTTTGNYSQAGSESAWTGTNTSNYFSYKTYYDQDNFYDRNVTTNYLDAAETASVNVEGSNGSASSAAYQKEVVSNNQVTSRIYDKTTSTSHWWGMGVDYTYTSHYKVYRDDQLARTTGFGGANASFVLNMLLDQALLPMLADGKLDYTVSALGDFAFRSVYLTLSADEAVSVPEPASLLLLVGGLLGMGLIGRRRRG